jgi:hypothetical protein
MYHANLECRDLDDIGIPEFLVDIYTLDRTQICNQPNIESSRDPHLKRTDNRNVIPITVSECKMRNIPLITLNLRGFGNRRVSSEELMCSNCANPAFFIRKIGNDWLCPQCAINKMQNSGIATRPECCGFPSGCDSCGGIVNRMLRIETAIPGNHKSLLLCLRDECLMPFGYCLPGEHIFGRACTCSIDFLSDLKRDGLLIDDLIETVGTFFDFRKIYGARREMVLGDLHMTRNDRCLPCQIATKYQLITDESSDWEIVSGKEATCSCSFSFLAPSSISRRQGSSTLSTPVSSTNRLRSQSNGDLTEEYTDSTSEI